jgi:electron transfer flavoprotein alpha subunit
MNKYIVVVAEHFRGQLNEITFELLGKGREVAKSLGGKLIVLLLGQDLRGFIGELGGADIVLAADGQEFREFTPDIYASLIGSKLKETCPRLVLLGSTSVGLDLLGLLSGRGAFPCIDSCVRLEAKESGVIATSQVYGGKVFAEIALPEETTLVAVVPGSFDPAAGRIHGNPEVQAFAPPPDMAASRVAFRKLIEPPPGDVDITRAPVLVGVGRGIQNAENLSLAEELAAALGGAVCASRPVIDQGWLPLTRQVGKSGMRVKPKLYLAFGISGAPEHLEGMKQSEMIVAVNTDPNAPIFSAAHYGVVADALDLLPALTEEIHKISMKKAS